MAKRNYLSIVLKGIGMGTADVIPGVSGGTIAFITGIYEELLDSIKSIDLTAAKLLFTFRLKEFWKKINGNFLFALVAGIAAAAFTLAKAMTWLLDNHPLAVWAFFFGLIAASTVIVARRVPKWTSPNILALALGGAAAYFLTQVTPTSTPDTWWFIMLSGAIAICAMILPGISGAFILVLLGKYHYILSAVTEFNIGIILLFLVGALAGILSFSRALSWLLHHHHNITIAALTGFMAGSLAKIWPWKTQTFQYTSDGSTVIEKNVTPGKFEIFTGEDPQLLTVIGLCVAGFAIIWAIEAISNRKQKKAIAADE